MVDLIFGPAGLEMTDEILQRAEPIPRAGYRNAGHGARGRARHQVMALDEYALDYTSLLGIARACREQIDWTSLRRRTSSSAYAQAFFALIEGLGITDAA
jgi:hypothetical protein